MRAFLLALLAVPAFAEDPLLAVEKRQQELFDKIAPSVVFISAGDGFGSGFFVDKNGLVLTSAHVVQKATKVNVVLTDGRKLVGEVVERGAENVDVALVQVPAQGTPALSLDGDAELRVGSWVGSIGHGRGGIWTFNTGMVSNIYPDGSARPVFQTQIPLNPGSSGGPVFDRQGRVAGIVTAGIENSNSINFAIRIDVAQRKLERLAGACECFTILAPPSVAVFVDGAMAGTGPKIVVPAKPKSYEVFAVVAGKMKKVQVRFPEDRVVDLR